ncbi:hypothetical protein NLX67_14995 [Domibacillus sp. A3M-37]|uniref:hypothetical protein n=1 Tax=Domibacillus sp. A3M-37 TaxID=2962037 RepID=UPI0020B73C15|nr:hypothetical protein [Domibacillus sp. A3M-37]MCP3763681.1 hypothetical protein [Domibacillus sp. A3M-37]
MDVKKLIAGSKEAAGKSMEQLIAEKEQKYRRTHNELRKKWIPERYDPNLDEEK